MTQTAPAVAPGRADLLPPLERRGVERIPAAEQVSTPWQFSVIFASTGYNLPTIVFGWLPLAFGLGFWPAITSMAAGVGVSLIPMAALIVLGTRTATNNATSSGADFGVRGRLIGSGLALALMLFGAAIAIWSGGGILVTASARLWGTPTGDGALAVAYIVLAALTVLIAFWGFWLLLRAARAVAVFGVVATALMLVAFAGHLHPAYRGGAYVLGTFWATWLLSAGSVGLGGVMTMATVPGDWTRYINGRAWSPGRVLAYALPAVVITYIPLGVGALAATALPNPAAAFPQALTAAAPGWYAVILVPFALIGGLTWSGASAYSASLDLGSIFARLHRPAAAVVMSAAITGLVLAGSLVWDASDSISALSLILLAVSGPWAAVIGVGWLRRRGAYDQDALQAFNRRARLGEATRVVAGPYWYRAGWNPAAVIAWAAGSTWGLLTVQTTLYTGPGAAIAGGVDLSFAGSFIIAAALYAALAGRR
jgi:purine-cytosine permease-like protein